MADPYEPDRPVICPYDSSHSIAQSRIQKHLVKCAKNFPPNYKISCPFNATHRLSETDLTDHVLRCPDNQYVDRGVWDHTKYHNHGSMKSCHEMEDRSEIVCDESWDDEESQGMDTPGGSVCRFDFSELPKIKQAPSFTVSGGPINSNTLIRPPKGRPEALMMDVSGDSAVEDIESVMSFAGMGRGKPWVERNAKLLEQLGRGRGSRQLCADMGGPSFVTSTAQVKVDTNRIGIPSGVNDASAEIRLRDQVKSLDATICIGGTIID